MGIVTLGVWGYRCMVIWAGLSCIRLYLAPSALC